MRWIKVLAAVLLVGAASVVLAQRFYKFFYRKWQYFTLYDEEPDQGAGAGAEAAALPGRERKQGG